MVEFNNCKGMLHSCYTLWFHDMLLWTTNKRPEFKADVSSFFLCAHLFCTLNCSALDLNKLFWLQTADETLWFMCFYISIIKIFYSCLLIALVGICILHRLKRKKKKNLYSNFPFPYFFNHKICSNSISNR